mmetsp:Transcript_20549/g.46780  ORF Transcript_20549/g.46780 Transcript_20549/m.46780 type:complete len:208 (-) Transcript_20549:19-642(-)
MQGKTLAAPFRSSTSTRRAASQGARSSCVTFATLTFWWRGAGWCQWSSFPCACCSCSWGLATLLVSARRPSRTRSCSSTLSFGRCLSPAHSRVVSLACGSGKLQRALEIGSIACFRSGWQHSPDQECLLVGVREERVFGSPALGLSLLLPTLSSMLLWQGLAVWQGLCFGVSQADRFRPNLWSSPSSSVDDTRVRPACLTPCDLHRQ